MRRDDQLTAAENQTIAEIQRMADQFELFIHSMGHTRETSLAVTNLQQAVMWAERHVKAR